MSDPQNQTALTNAEIERDDILAAAAVEGRRDDPFFEPGDELLDPEPLPESEPPSAPKAFMILLARPNWGETAIELIWREGGGQVDRESLRVPSAVRSGYAVCEDARMEVVFEDRDEQRGVVRRGYDVIGNWRAARPEDFESRPGRQFITGFADIPDTLRAVYAKGQEDGRKAVVADVKQAIGLDGSEG